MQGAARPGRGRSSGMRLAVLEEAARRYDRCHPDDSFADLARRAAFSKEDRRLMQDWLAVTGRDIGGTRR